MMPFGVYCLYAEDDTLLYVGFSNHLMRRVGEHADQKGWWRDVASARFEHFDSREEALKREAQLILEAFPLYNKLIPYGRKTVEMENVLIAAKAKRETAALLTEAVRRARKEHTLARIGRELGITPQRVHQIANGE